VVEDKPIFVPLADLRGKTKESIRETVKQSIIDSLTADLVEFHAAGANGIIDDAVSNDLDRLDLVGDEMVNGLANTVAKASKHSEEALERAQQLVADSIALAEKTVSDPEFERQMEQNIEELHRNMCAGREGSGADSGVADGAGGTLSC